MAQLTESSININGKPIAQFSSFTLQQNIFEHHNFTLVCPAESIDGKLGSVFNQSKELIGATINAQIKMIGGTSALNFVGIVTQIETARFSGHAGDLIITGYSPTIILDSGPHCKSWENKALKYIANDTLSHFPQNLLNPQINPFVNELYPYTVQYKETGWQFLNRLCAAQGEWFYYNGESLVLGMPKGVDVKLIFGSNLSRFNMSLQVRPSNFQMMSYDYIKNEVYDTTPKNIPNIAGLDHLGVHTYEKSNVLFASQPKQWCNNNTTTKKQLDAHSNTKAAVQSSNMVRFNGASGCPSVQLGNVVDVNGSNVFNGNADAYGKFTIIGVTHHTDGQGNYNNDFLAIPASIIMPPVVAYAEPHCETQSAIVTDNNDPEGLGRVRVRFHWMKSSEKSPWIRIATAHAGGDKGHFFIPEIEEEAIVCFEADNALKPFVNGTVYHGNAKTGFGSSQNDLKVIRTRSGHTIELNDANGGTSIIIKDNGGNIITMDTKGHSMTLMAPQNITFVATNISMLASSNIEMVAGNHFQASAAELMKLDAKYYKNNVSEKMTVFSKQSLLFSEDEMKLESNDMAVAGVNKLFMHSDSLLQANSKGTLNIKGEGGNKMYSTAEAYETATKEIEAKCVGHFRPSASYKGEFGFDWLRLGDTSIKGDNKYEDIIGSYGAAYATSATAVFTKSIAKFKALRSGFYSPLTIPWKKDSAGNAEFYGVSTVALYPKDTGKISTATLQIILEVEEEPEEIKVEYDKALFKVDKDKITPKTKGKHKINITVECLKEFSTDKEINLMAYNKNTANPVPVPVGKLAGKLKVLKNDIGNRYETDIVLVKMKVNVSGSTTTGSAAGESALAQKFLKQALVTANVKEETFDITADAAFNTDYYLSAYAAINWRPAGKSPLTDYVEAAYNKANPAYVNHYKVFLFDELGGYMSGTSYQGLNGAAKDINSKAVVVFNTKTTSTGTHELLHAYGLYHTFDNNSTYVYEIFKTENIMDYSHQKGIDRITITKWQWLKLQGVLTKEKPPAPPPTATKPTAKKETVGDFI